MAFLRFLAIVVTGVAPIPSGAHLFARPNKLPMPAEDYVTRAGHRGWALFGIALFGAAAANLALGAALWRRGLSAFPVGAVVAVCERG
jgi:hypothetical protein